jgi:molybdenum cofactor cytidylyltransferase
VTIDRAAQRDAVVGILLAAGRGERFGGDKLLALLPGAECIGAASVRNLLAAVSEVVAVVRPDDHALAAALGANGARIVRCANADDGMGASLACAVQARPDARGWIVALADMPWIEPATIARVADAVAGGALIAAPFHHGERGHPVGFGNACYAALAALTGDEGAKAIVAAHRDRIARIDVDDAGILRDIDTRADLR